MTKERGVIALFFLRIINFILKKLGMAQIDINTGFAYEDPLADSVKTSFDACQSNFDELFSRRFIIYFSGWNMDTSDEINVVWIIPTGLKLVFFDAIIINNAANTYFKISNADGAGVSEGIITYSPGSDRFELQRLGGGLFDSASFNAASGYIIAECDLV